MDNLTLPNLYLALTTSAPEQIFALLVNHFRHLLMVKDKVGHFPDWKQAKLEKQAAKYSLSQLSTHYLELLHIDFKQKTSSSPYNLLASLELWVSRL
jgi:hypothetical protein